MKKILLFITATLLLTGCAYVRNEWVDLEEYSQLDKNKAFIPYYTELDGDNATNTISSQLVQLENESDFGDGDNTSMRTTGINMVGVAKSIFSWWHSDTSRSYCGTYMSVDQNGNPILLSGRIIVPIKGEVSRIMVVSHFTIGSNVEAPTMSFPLEGILASRGMAVIIPDYIGYGITADKIHPYLCADLTAQNVVDMYFASLPFLKHINRSPKNNDIILFGYSQGGATTMAVARKFEYEYPNVDIRLILAGGGPYDICTTYDKLIDKDFTDYPCAIPLIIQGMNYGHNLNLDYSKFFQQNVLDNMDEWINSKKYTMAEITTLMGTKKLSDIMTKDACNKVSDGMTSLYLAMLTNSIAGNYYPMAPTFLFHSMDDNVVPFENAEMMLQNIQMMNVQYNFGHYGNHTSGYLRFLYTCLNILYENGDIPNIF